MSAQGNPFMFPLRELQNDRLKLVPFILGEHGPDFINGTRGHPNLFDYMPIGPYETLGDLDAFLKSRIFSSDAAVCFAILIKPSSAGDPDILAGMIGYLNSSLQNLVTEIGFVTILPKYHGTFVTKNATGLLMMYALDAPPAGLGLRRCVWQCHAGNEASKRFARKMLFSFEGRLRFERTMPAGKADNGIDVSNATGPFGKDAVSGRSRDTEVYAHYCDEWAGKRPAVVAIMVRV